MILLAVALASATPESDKLIGVYGFPGHDSCANWTENRSNRGRYTQALEGWVLGYLTAYNAYEDETGRVDPTVNATSAFGWIDQYCAEHPLDDMMTATIKLITELRNRRGPVQ